MKKLPNAVIDLTSLLDVIFIILFLVMRQNAAFTAQAQQDAGELQQALDNAAAAYASLLEDAQAAETLLEGFQQLQESALCLAVSILPLPDDAREILLAAPDETTAIRVTWQTTGTASRQLRQYLETALANHDDMPVFLTFQFDSGAIYRRDYAMITAALTEVQTAHSNVYLKFIDLAGNDFEE